jgi:hypothetical protein
MANTFRVHFGNNTNRDFVADTPDEVRKLPDKIALAQQTVIRKIKRVREVA